MKEYYAGLIEELRESSLRRITSLAPETLGEERFMRDGSTVLETSSFGDENTIEETLSLRPTLVLFGAGHIGRALAPLAKMLDFPLTVVDDREDFLSDPAFDGTTKIPADFEKLDEAGIKADNPYWIIITHGHRYDTTCLEWCLRRKSRYTGMIGSRKKIAYAYDQLRKKGITDEELSGVKAPIGLDINASTPAEIAVSIMAEIIGTFRQMRNDITAETDFITAVRDTEEPLVLARIIEKKGSGPREVGCEMAVLKDRIIGTIGGGAIEEATIRIGREMLDAGTKARKEEFVLTPEQALGMACGGGATVLFRRID